MGKRKIAPPSGTSTEDLLTWAATALEVDRSAIQPTGFDEQTDIFFQTPGEDVPTQHRLRLVRRYGGVDADRPAIVKVMLHRDAYVGSFVSTRAATLYEGRDGAFVPHAGPDLLTAIEAFWVRARAKNAEWEAAHEAELGKDGLARVVIHSPDTFRAVEGLSGRGARILAV